MSVRRRSARAWRIALGAVLVLVEVVNTARLRPSASQAGALGRVLGALLLLGLAAWLISSGLPKSIGLPREIQAIRRAIWYRLVGVGFLVMVGVALPLSLLSLGVFSLLAMWLYWFGWTWISWLIADKRAVRKFAAVPRADQANRDHSAVS